MMWAITKAKSLSCKIQITTASGKYLVETKCGHLNHIPFGGTWRKPETTDVVVPTIGHLLFLYCFVLSTAKFPERY